MKYIILIILLLAIINILSGCSIGKLEPTIVSDPVRLITTTIYPDLPLMSHPPKLGLNNPVWDVPRDLTKPLSIKRLTNCIKVPVIEQDDNFWIDCGEYPPIPQSNIYRGYSYDDYQLFLLNNDAIRNKLKAYGFRIDAINQQREEWRLKNVIIDKKDK